MTWGTPVLNAVGQLFARLEVRVVHRIFVKCLRDRASYKRQGVAKFPSLCEHEVLIRVACRVISIGVERTFGWIRVATRVALNRPRANLSARCGSDIAHVDDQDIEQIQFP